MSGPFKFLEISDIAVDHGRIAVIGKTEPTGTMQVIVDNGQEIKTQFENITHIIQAGDSYAFTASDFLFGTGKGEGNDLYKINDNAYGYSATINGARWFFLKDQKFGPYGTIEQDFDDPSKFTFKNGENKFSGQYKNEAFSVGRVN